MKNLLMLSLTLTLTATGSAEQVPGTADTRVSRRRSKRARVGISVSCLALYSSYMFRAVADESLSGLAEDGDLVVCKAAI
jgi:hypothetical protein